tara:strand:- start:685 stop:1917 length:1233 start_codon:yes stop_codon:yes gene_type:complete
MKKTNYAIIGGGLTGCIIAFLISKKIKNAKVKIFESRDHLMSSFDSINIKGKSLNNGYHALELPRAQEAMNTINQIPNLKLIKLSSRKGLIIEEKLIEINSTLDKWPENIKKHFEKKIVKGNIEYLKAKISDEYLDKLKMVSKRYCDDFTLVENLMIPWFLPKNYIINSEDEGDLFRNDIKLNKYKAQSIVTNSGLFEEIQEPFKKLLEELKVELKFNNQIIIDSESKRLDESKFNIKKFYKTFFCSSPIFVLKQINFELYKKLLTNEKSLYNILIKICRYKPAEYYSEILVLDEKDISISRLSFPNNLKSDKDTYIQIEVFEKDHYEDIIEKRIPENIRRLLKINKKYKIELIGIINSRKSYFPSKEYIKNATEEIDNWKIKNDYDIEFLLPFGPINMAKSAIIAKNNI